MPIILGYTSSFGLHPSGYHVIDAIDYNANLSPTTTVSGSSWIDKSAYTANRRKIEQFSIPRLDDQQNKIGWLPKMNVPSGTYFIQASTNYIKQTQKILFIK